MYLYTDHHKDDRSRFAQHEGSLGVAPPILMTTAACISLKRTCCLLAPPWFIDPSLIGNHHSSMNEKNGIIYTGGAGFIDTSHLRHCCDDTKHVYDQLMSSSGSSSVATTSHGVATIKKSVPRSMWTQVARAISYSDSVGYEITTYRDSTPGGHNSAFSPEDLCSNYLGAYVAERAITSPPKGSKDFNTAVTHTLNDVLTKLKAQPLVETEKAFNFIVNCWMSPNTSFSVTNLDYWGNMTLKRRNLSITPTPWKVGHPSDFQTPTWVTQVLGPVSQYYDFTYHYASIDPTTGRSVRMTLRETDFPKEISTIRTDASDKTKYGQKYDQPTCP